MRARTVAFLFILAPCLAFVVPLRVHSADEPPELEPFAPPRVSPELWNSGADVPKATPKPSVFNLPTAPVKKAKPQLPVEPADEAAPPQSTLAPLPSSTPQPAAPADDMRFEPLGDRSMTSMFPMAASVQPTVELRQRIPDSVRFGTPVVIEIMARNVGASVVSNVTIVNDLDPEVEFVKAEPTPERREQGLVWTIGQLAPEQSTTIKLTLQMKKDSKSLALKNTPRVRLESGATGVTRILKPKISLEVTGPTVGTLGEPMTYSIAITNTGNIPAANVMLFDTVPAGLSHPYGPDLENEVGRLGVGETRKIRLTLTPNRVGKIQNKIVVTGDDVQNAEHDQVLDIQEVKLALTGTSPKSKFVNRPCTYQFTVTNEGGLAAKTAKLVATIPEGITFAQASDGGRHDSSVRTVSWTLGDLKPGETRSIGMTGIASQSGDQVCRAVLTAAGDFQQTETWTTQVRGVSALLFEVLDVDDPVELGSETIYEIRVVNQGTVPATNVRVAATLPREMEGTGAEGPTENHLQDDVLTFDPIPSLAPQADVTYRVKVRGAKSGDCRFRATLITDQLSRPVVKEESTTIYSEDN